jgi:cell division protein FtsB
MKAPRITGSTIVNVLGSAAALYLVTVLAQTVHRNYQLGNQIDELKAQISLVQAQKTQLSNTIQYYQTDSFHDRDARSKLGLQLPGENVVIVPHSSAAPTPEAQSTKTAPAPKRSNLQAWMDFFAGRP